MSSATLFLTVHTTIAITQHDLVDYSVYVYLQIV